jgi:hypothetical protein
MHFITQKSQFVNSYFNNQGVTRRCRAACPPGGPSFRHPRARCYDGRRSPASTAIAVPPHPTGRIPAGPARAYFAEKTGKNTLAQGPAARDQPTTRELRNSSPVRLLTHSTACTGSHMFDGAADLTSRRLDGSYAAKNTTVSVAKRSVGVLLGANWPISTVGSATKRCYKVNKDELGGCLKRQTPCIIRPVVHLWR